MTMTFWGPPNQPIILFSGAALAPANFLLDTLAPPPTLTGAGFIDVGPFPALTFIADGTQPGLINSFFNTGPLGTTSLSLLVPPALSGLTLHLQAVVFSGGLPLIRATNAVSVAVN
jgi:hypothetical protein